jgi:hypothetical protein
MLMQQSKWVTGVKLEGGLKKLHPLHQNAKSHGCY